MDLPMPVPTGHDAPFWAAADEEKLLLQRCVTSGRYQWFPRARSIHVAGGDVEWVESPGHGHVETYSVVARSFYPALPAPYVIGMVRLDEGVLLTALIVDAPADTVSVDMPVTVVFRALDGERKVPCFRPAGSAP
jgi:uncharacterized OB-fold protein